MLEIPPPHTPNLARIRPDGRGDVGERPLVVKQLQDPDPLPRTGRYRASVAHAIGKEPPEPLELPADADDEAVEQLAWRQLRTCFDPEIPINVVDLGLVYEASVKPHPDQPGQRRVEIRMTLTAPACGMGDILVADVRVKLEMIPTVAEADVELVFDPPWSRNMMSEVARLETGMF